MASQLKHSQGAQKGRSQKRYLIMLWGTKGRESVPSAVIGHGTEKGWKHASKMHPFPPQKKSKK